MAEIDIKNIYDYLGQKVDEVQNKLKEHSQDDDDEKVAKEAAFDSVSQCKAVLDKNIKEYKENQELNAYTMAFYGETNAGKSTLIESLRLLLKEKSKMEEIEKFNEKIDEINRKKNNLEKLKADFQEKINIKEADILATKDKFTNEIADENSKLNDLLKKHSEIIEDENSKIIALKDKFISEIADENSKLNDLLKKHSEILKDKERSEIDPIIKDCQIKLEILDDLNSNNLKEKIEFIQNKEKTRHLSFFKKIKLFFFDDDIRKKLKTIDGLYFEFLDLQAEQEKEQNQKQNEIIELETKYQNLISEKESKLKNLKAEQEKEQNQKRNEIIELETKYQNLISEKENKLARIKLEQESIIFNEKNEINHLTIELSQYEDGSIIGNGKSDFTRSNSYYKFTQNGQEFQIIDMPGIEGDEKIVINEIEKAVKQAHCVFYVTSEPQPPQKGENGKKGTIEKIKDHLSAQSEVYTIYNKRITSPRPLNHEIVSEDALKSLKVLDQKMSEILGDHYAYTKIISARIAFLSLTCAIAPNTNLEAEQNKFLSKYNKEELLEKSMLLDFTNFLSNELVTNTKEKIRLSNISKAKNVLEQFMGNIKSIIESYTPLCESIKSSYEDGKFALENSLRGTKSEIESCADKCIAEFRDRSEERIYDIIAENISDDDFKYELERVLEDEIETLKGDLDDNLKICFNKFGKKIEEDVEEFKRKISINVKDFKDNIELNSNVDLSINIDNGIDKIALVGSLVGAAGLVGAWIAGSFASGGALVIATLVVGIATVVISLVKSVRKFFSDDYKMKEQRKAADENIRKNARKISNALSQKFETIFEEMDGQIQEISNRFYDSYERISSMLEHFNSTHKELENISKDFK